MIVNKNWARELSKGLIDLGQLKNENIIKDNETKLLEPVKDHFDIRIPHIFLEQIKNKSNALTKQFVPSLNELIFLPEELEDPIGDERFTPVNGITHRYPDRLLLKLTYMCASYCRFCFRRYKVSNLENNLNPENFEKAIPTYKWSV